MTVNLGQPIRAIANQEKGNQPHSMYRISFILVQPKVPENVGAAARALKTMGFSDLRIVNSTAHTAEEARRLAHGSTDILDQAAVFETLNEALHDCDFAIGTTARFRASRRDYHPPERLLDILREKGRAISHVAIVFGREETGLTNEEMALCDIATSIPMKTKHPSLNLGQSVMLYAYELSRLLRRPSGSRSPRKNEASQQALLKQKGEGLILALGVKADTPLHQRFMERLNLLRGVDLPLAQAIIERIRKKIGA
jgi:tRNA/rRNA methyltransferase